MKMIVAFLIALTSFHVSASDTCGNTYAMAASAARNKSNGLKEHDLRAPLSSRDLFADQPDDPRRKQLVQMHEIVDELYSVSQIDSQVYAIFKAEQCVHQFKGEPFPTFKESSEKLIACGADKDKITCAMKAAQKSTSGGI